MTSKVIEHSIMIDNSNIETIRRSLTEYKSWVHWSSWLQMEEDVTLIYRGKVSEVGSSYAWAGNVIGAGSMEVLDTSSHTMLMKLVSVKPYLFEALLRFSFEKYSNDIHLTCAIEITTQPWTNRHIQSLLTRECQQGLLLLKGYIEEGSVASLSEIEGVCPLSA